MLDKQEEEYIRMIYAEYSDYIKKLCYVCCRGEDFYLDCFQNVFCVCMTNVGKLMPMEDIRPWLCRVVKWVCCASYQKKRACKEKEFLYGDIDLTVGYEPEMCSGLDIEKDITPYLTKKQKKLFDLYFLEDKSPAEIAERLGLRPDTVHSGIGKLKKKLRTMLSKYR